MEGTEGFYLINDKYHDGAKKKKYKLNPKDTETKGKFHRYGSIMGTKIIVKIDNKEYIQALLTISTYGKKLILFHLEYFVRNWNVKLRMIYCQYLKLILSQNLCRYIWKKWLKERMKMVKGWGKIFKKNFVPYLT